ncbi:MAG: hypothetical protein FWG49_03640 [Leptospirales bacterium]|nr:hypothetical protein [Leptospirales bacterium]
MGLKVILALRDDIKSLFTDLLNRLDLKKELLHSLLEKEKTIFFLIKDSNDRKNDCKNDIEESVKKIIEDENDLIEEINVEDYNIAQIREEIRRKYSFGFDKIFAKNYTTSEVEIIDYKNKILLHEGIIKELVKLKKDNNDRMEKYAADLNVQICELAGIERLRYVIKDLQSS